MFLDDESSEEHPNSFYQDGSYEEDEDSSPSDKGCLVVMAIILILSLLLRYL